MPIYSGNVPTVNCIPAPDANPIVQFIELFPTVGDAAAAAGVTREQLRKFRHRGYVSTRDRALHMARACSNRLSPARLMDLPRRAA